MRPSSAPSPCPDAAAAATAVVLAAAVVVLSTCAVGAHAWSPPTACPVQPPLVTLQNVTANPDVMKALQDVDAMLSAAVMPTTAIPGLIAVVVQGNNIVWGKGFGSVNFTKPEAPEPDLDTMVRVASITKVFTSLAMFHARDHGVLSLDDPVTKYIPGFNPMNPYNTTRPITLRQLASHTSGLPRENPCDLNCTEAQVLAKVAEQFLIYPQYTRPHYSNLGYALLGRAVGHAANASYEDYVTNNLLRPMGVAHGGFVYTPYVAKHLATGVDNSGNVVDVSQDQGWDGWEAPAGALFASADGMSQLMRLMLRQNAAADGELQVVDSSTVDEMLRPAIQLRDGEAAFGTPWEFQYLGDQEQGVWVKSKAGELSGYRSQVALVPELGLGIFVSAFRSDVTPFDTSDSVWTIPALQTLIPPITAALQAAQPAPVLPADYKTYVGTYGPVDQEIKIDVDQAQTALVGVFLNATMNLTEYPHGSATQKILRVTLPSPGTTACRWLDDGDNGELAYFDVPASSGGVATSVSFMGGVYDRRNHV